MQTLKQLSKSCHGLGNECYVKKLGSRLDFWKCGIINLWAETCTSHAVSNGLDELMYDKC